MVIYTLASAEHPYEQGSFREEPTDVPETPQSIGARMATNWADYRTTYGEIRVGEIGAREKASWESMSKALIAFKVWRTWPGYGRSTADEARTRIRRSGNPKKLGASTARAVSAISVVWSHVLTLL